MYQSVTPSIVTVQSKVGDTTTIVLGRGGEERPGAHLGPSPRPGRTAVTVLTYDGRTITAKVLGSDPDTDLALLEVPNGDLKFAALATGSEPDVGQAVVAVGAGKGESGLAWA